MNKFCTTKGLFICFLRVSTVGATHDIEDNQPKITRKYMTYSRSQAKEYILQSQSAVSLISLTNPSYCYADWKRAIKAFELCSKAIEVDPYLAEAYFGRASCSQLFYEYDCSWI